MRESPLLPLYGYDICTCVSEKRPCCGALTRTYCPELIRGQGMSNKEKCTLHTAEGMVCMNFILWRMIGGILGWIARVIMGGVAQLGILLYIVVGLVGSLLAAFLLTPLFGIGTINQNNFS